MKLLDFGIAQLIAEDAGAVSATRIFTPEYAAPEQVRGDVGTTAVDIYALGGLAFTLFSGRPPFDGRVRTQLMSAQVHMPPPKLVERGPDAPAVLDALVAACRAKAPAVGRLARFSCASSSARLGSSPLPR